tara:strand:+ start:54 stop:356 length:303 start_codon:yes stop_codon:yes gene_type:complete
MTENRTESIMTRCFSEGRDWTEIDDKREFRIGMFMNCNGEISRNEKNLNETKFEIKTFLKKNKINEYIINTINNTCEYSNQIIICNNDYNKLKNNFKHRI